MRPDPSVTRTCGLGLVAAVVGGALAWSVRLTVVQGITMSISLFLLLVWGASQVGSPCWFRLYDYRVGVPVFVILTIVFGMAFLTFEPVVQYDGWVPVCGGHHWTKPRLLSAFVSYAPSLPYGISRVVELFSSHG